MSITLTEYRKAKKVVEAYEKQYPAKRTDDKRLNPNVSGDFIQLLTGKKIGDSFNSGFAYAKGYRNDFEGYVYNPGYIEGINKDGNFLKLRFLTGGSLFPQLDREEEISYKYINQSIDDYCKKYRLCIDKRFILRIIGEQMFQHFIAWYGPSFRPEGNNTNMYRMVEDVIDRWNLFITKGEVSKAHSTYIVEIFNKFSPVFWAEMPANMKKRIGTSKLMYMRKSDKY